MTLQFRSSSLASRLMLLTITAAFLGYLVGCSKQEEAPKPSGSGYYTGDLKKKNSPPPLAAPAGGGVK